MNTFSITWMGILSCFLAYTLILLYFGQSSRGWTATKAKLVEFRVVNARFVSIKLKYEYVVKGKKYIGRRISFLNPIYESEAAIESDELCKRIKQGEFEVYYNEKIPKISTVETGFKGWSKAIIIIVLFLLGICGIAVSWIK